jgi:predicted SAM-dependent methyltransferase
MKLHLGCGKRFIPGFIHIDKSNMKHIDYVTEVDNLSMFNDDSVDLIYASHVLEYYSYFECIDVLKEWYRVLKPNAILRLSVPDFDKLINVYQSTNNDINKIIGPLYGRMKVINDDGSSTLIFHRTVFNKLKLKSILLEAGFNNVVNWDWRNTEHANYDDYSQAYFPHMDKDKGLLISLNLEASKS